jgi:hypothetical protein
MMVGKVVLIVLGGILCLVALAALVGGGFLLWANYARRDASGFFTTGSHPFMTPSRALVTDGFDVDASDAGFLFDSGHLARVRLRGSSDDPAKRIFIGIGPTADVNAYLAGVSHAQVSDVDLGPFKATYQPHTGTEKPAAPGTRRFWAASVSGAGTRTLIWPVEDGDWSVAVMNSDASPGVQVHVSAGAKAAFPFRLGLGLAIGGILVLLLGIALIVLGTMVDRRAPPAPSAGGSAV